MKYRYQLTSAFVAVLVLTSLQAPSNAQMPASLSMASGMSKAQKGSMEYSLSQAYADAMAAAKGTSTRSVLATSVTQEANARYKCSAGGYINTTMTVRTVVTHKTGNASVSGFGHQTISSWRCIKGWIVNGDPYISHTTSSSTIAGKVNTRVYVSGGWKAIGPNKAKQTCQTTSETQYSEAGSGFRTVHTKCVPGGSTDVTTRF